MKGIILGHCNIGVIGWVTAGLAKLGGAIVSRMQMHTHRRFPGSTVRSCSVIAPGTALWQRGLGMPGCHRPWGTAQSHPGESRARAVSCAEGWWQPR